MEALYRVAYGDESTPDQATPLERQRSVYLRGTSGRLWGRPANGVESRWLLTGFSRCGWCGGMMEVRTLDARYCSREPLYQCASYVRRGTTVSANRLALPAALAHDAVLDAIEADLLHPDVVSHAIHQTVEDLQRPHAADPAQTAGLKDELETLDGQMRNLTATL